MVRLLTHECALWSPPAGVAVELDLGCGNGAFLAGLARRYPQRLIVGADVMLSRLRKAANRCQRGKLGNVELWRAAAWSLVGSYLPDRCLDRVHVICPEPWPKRKHRANRLLTSEFCGRLATKLKLGGVLHVATDDAAYWDFVLAAIGPLPVYRPAADACTDIADLRSEFEETFAAQGVAVRHAVWRVGPAAAAAGRGASAPGAEFRPAAD